MRPHAGDTVNDNGVDTHEYVPHITGNGGRETTEHNEPRR